MSEDAIQTIGSLPTDEIRQRGLMPAAPHVLQAALERGKITPREIAFFIPKDMQRNREQLSAAITWLNEFLKSQNVKLLADKEETLHRAQFPVVGPPKPEFRIVERRSEVAFKELKEVITLERLTEDDENYSEYDVLARYYAEIRRFPLLTPDEEMELGKRILNDRDLGARNRLIEHNLRLVRWIARRFVRKYITLEFEDLLQAGNTGLIKAAEKYDYRTGRFTTYAVWWIRQAISRSIMNEGSMIRLPVHTHDLRNKVLGTAEQIAEETGGIPSVEEIAERTQLPPERVLRTLLTLRLTAVSLSEPMKQGVRGDNKGSNEVEVGDIIPDENMLNPEQLVEAKQELSAARKRMNTLLLDISTELDESSRNLDVFRTFYSFDEKDKKRTLESTGNCFGITRERVRQIIARIWLKINEHGAAVNHKKFLAELKRIENLWKLVGPEDE